MILSSSLEKSERGTGVTQPLPHATRSDDTGRVWLEDAAECCPETRRATGVPATSAVPERLVTSDTRLSLTLIRVQ